jgi:heme-degrading monooxygenase HmoA
MIIREWRGRADPKRADAYPKHFREHVLPELKRLPGFRGAHLGRHMLGKKVEFVALTRWDSLESIRAFAGAEIEKAIVEPGGVAALLEFDDRVHHYEVVEAA